MTLLRAELLVLALILVRAFICLRIPARDNYTTERTSNDNLSGKV
jgi:hypothetical protein